jgi:hypothetical protein
MNRIVILRLDPVARRLLRLNSSTRRAGFYAADMAVKIIFDVIRGMRQPVAHRDPIRPA